MTVRSDRSVGERGGGVGRGERGESEREKMSDLQAFAARPCDEVNPEALKNGEDR